MSGPDEPLESVLTGKKLGHYRLGPLIGRGGAGIVFRARDTHLGRRVAIKVLQHDSGRDEAMFQRFVQEARLAAQLSHPNVVTIYEVNQDGEHVYIAMELLDGGSIQDRLVRSGRLDWETAARTLESVCCGLEAAHCCGLIHRDIKPANILANAFGEVKLSDFGLARCCVAGDASLTTDGMVLGTPLFMSPEQCEGQPADGRSDIYSLGATFHALLTGSPPYLRDEPLHVAFAHCSAPIPDPRAIDVSIPESCSAIVRRAMAKQPADRYQTAGEMVADLNCCLGSSDSTTPPPPPAHPIGPSIITGPSIGLSITTGSPRAKPGSTDQLSLRARANRSHRRRNQWLLAIGAAISLAAGICLLVAFSASTSVAGRKPAREAEDRSVGLPSTDTAGSPVDSGEGPITPRAESASLTSTERLDVLLEKPTSRDIHSTLAAWKAIDYEAGDWRDEGGRSTRMEFVSYRVDGGRQYAVIRYPEEFSSEDTYAALVFCNGNEEYFSLHDLRALKMRIPAFSQCITVMPTFRGSSITLRGAFSQTLSASDRGSVVDEATDVMALLDLASEHIAQFDATRVVVIGSGSRGAVALHLAARDSRVKAVIAADADLDCFHPVVRRAIARASASGEAPETRLERTVWREIVEPLLAGTKDLAAARKHLLGLSPAQFVRYLPPTQIYYGAFTNDYDVRQGSAFRDAYVQHGRSQRHFVFRHFAAGPDAPMTVRGIQHDIRPLMFDVVGGRSGALR